MGGDLKYSKDLQPDPNDAPSSIPIASEANSPLGYHLDTRNVIIRLELLFSIIIQSN